jgi:two-component system sensor histidine kinase TctE
MTLTSNHIWSIRRRVLAWLAGVMGLVFLANLGSSYVATRRAADSAFDSLLLASASAIAERTSIRKNAVYSDIPYAALDMLASTAQDQVYYAVSAPDGGLVTGYEQLPKVTGPDGGKGEMAGPRFFDAEFRGALVRMVELRAFVAGGNRSGFVTVRVAQTRGERDAVVFGLLRQNALWMLVFFLTVGSAAWLGISYGLRPLDRLRDAIGRRSPDDVRPLRHDVPEEFGPMIEALNGMLRRLDDGMSSMRRFISDASHQLKTPLASLQAQTELALREKDDKALRKSLKKVNRGIVRTSRLAQQLLSHARTTHPAGPFRRVDMAAMAREIISIVHTEAVSKTIDLGYEGAATAFLEGDRTLLGEMLLNLLDNAVKYCPEKSVITLSVTKTSDTLQVVVEDNGPGIPARYHSTIFDRFTRLPGSSADGCGLGLAIVLETVNAHHGKVELDEGDTGGLRVRISLPVTGQEP